MRNNLPTFLLGMSLATLGVLPARGVQIIGDNYNVTGSGSGFALGSGANSGINPPTTRLTGTAAVNLRYINTGTKATSAYTITSNKLRITSAADPGRFVLSADGTTPFNFAPALGTALASPANPVVYDISISMDNDSTSNQRFSFALGTAESDANSWDFGFQIYRTNSANNFYIIGKRIDTDASGLAADLNEAIHVMAANTYGTEITILMRVTDAGSETTTFNSRVQLSLNGGSTWIYDTATDPDLVGTGWRLNGAGRILMWDAAPGAGNVTYDNFTLNWVSGPRTWNGAGANGNWSTGANWGGAAPVTGSALLFSGTTRQSNTNDLSGLTVPWLVFNNGGFSLYGNTFTNSSAITNLAGNNTLKGGLAWSSTAAKTWNIASGTELVLDNINSVEVNGDHALSGGGTLRLKGAMDMGQLTAASPVFLVNEGKMIIDGGSLNTRNGYRIGASVTGTGAQTILTNGASLAVTTSTGNLRVGDASNPNGAALYIDNSTVALGGGNLAIPYAAGATAVVSQVGGTISGGTVNYNYSGAGKGIYTNKNGTLETVQIKKTLSGGQSEIHFDNTLLRTAAGANATFFTGLDLAEILSGGLTIEATSDALIGQVLSGVGGLTKEGGSEVTLSGNNTFADGVVLNTGTLNLGNDSALGSGTLTINGGALAASGGARQISNAINVAGNFSVGGVDAMTLSGNVSLGGASRVVTVNSSATAALSGVLNGAGGLTKDGSGLLQLSGAGANTYSGNTVINAGTLSLAKTSGVNAIAGDAVVGDGVGGAGADVLRLNAANQISDSSVIDISASGLFDLNGFSETASSVSGSSGTSQIALGAGALTVGDAGNSTFAGSISGNGSLVKQGSGKLTLAGASTFSGTATINDGVLNVQSATALGASGATTVSSGAALEVQGGISVTGEPATLNGAGISSGGALRNISGNNSWSGAVTLGSDTRIQSDSGTLTVSGNVGGSGKNLTLGGVGNTSISGSIGTGAGTVTKQDGGTVTLSGVNSYAGGTTISAGTLALGAGGSIASSTNITIANSATLNVSAVSGYALAGNQTLARNANSGVGNVNGSVTFNTGAKVSLMVNGTSGSVGSIGVTGGLTLNSNTITVNVTSSALGVGNYSLITHSGARSGTFNLVPTITGSGLKTGLKAALVETVGLVSLRVFPIETNSIFRVMSYNIHSAAGPDGVVDTQRIADFILAQNVDLVGLNEVSRFMPRGDNRDIIGELAQETGMAYVFSNNMTGLSGNDEFGNAILSKYPILFRDHRLLPNVGANEQRGWLKAVVDVKGKFISFQVTHLDFHADDTERLMCVTNINNWLADETLPSIICGDFNETPDKTVHARMETKWDDIWPIAGDGSLGRTSPCPGPVQTRIDYIYRATGSNLKPTNAFVGYSVEASDHFPVLTQFILNTTTDHERGFCFPFDEGSGTTVTDSIGGLVGTADAGSPSWNTNSPSGDAGDYSLFFNGSKKLTVPDPKQVIGTNGFNEDYTIQAWVKVAVNYAPAQRAVLFQYDRVPGFSISINTNRTLHTTAFKVKDVPSNATLPNDGQWHHVAVVHTEGANMKFYIDGALSATVTYTNGSGYRTTSAITIGAGSEGANWFTGYLDRIRFENRALTPVEFDSQAGSPQLNRIAPVTDNGSVFKIVRSARQPDGRFTLTWAAESGKQYVVQSTDDLSKPFTDVVSGLSQKITAKLIGGVLTQTFIDDAVPTNGMRYYRIKSEP